MTDLAFVDTETTGLDPDRHPIWEVAVVTATHETDRLVVDGQFVLLPNLPVGTIAQADPYALKIGGYYDRGAAFRQKHACRREYAAMKVAAATRGRLIVGAVPSFDTLRLDRLLREHDECPMWHYHLIDVEALAAGYLMGRAWEPPQVGAEKPTEAAPPWNSDALTAALGVTVPDDERHTALGDARWAMRTYAAVYSLTIVEEANR